MQQIDKTHSYSPFFSVVLPIFNREKTICRALDSILIQDFKDFEIIVVDDGSTDKTLELVANYQDERIKIFQKENGGVSSARNFGMQYAGGKYITFIDSDDYVLQGFFQDAFQVLQERDLDMLIYGGLFYCSKKITKAPIFWDKKRKITSSPEIILARDFFKDFCQYGGNSWACAKFIKREMILKNQILFDQKIDYGEDLVFNLHCAYASFYVGLQDGYFYFYDNLSESLSRGVEAITKERNLFRGYENLKSTIADSELLGYIAFNTIIHILGNSFKFSSLFVRTKEEERLFLSVLEEVPKQLINKHMYLKIMYFFMKKFPFAKINILLAILGIYGFRIVCFILNLSCVRKVRGKIRIRSRIRALISQVRLSKKVKKRG